MSVYANRKAAWGANCVRYSPAPVVPLESAGTQYQVGPPALGPQNFTGEVYVATPQLLATYGIKASQGLPASHCAE